MSVPHDWIPTAPTPAGPPREHVLAGLRGTDEGPDLVQLLTPEGERVACPEFDSHVADVDTATLQGLYRDMVLVRRADREATALQRQGELGIWVIHVATALASVIMSQTRYGVWAAMLYMTLPLTIGWFVWRHDWAGTRTRS